MMQSNTLRMTLNKIAFLSGGLVFVLTFSLSLYLGFEKSQEEEARRHQSIHKILGELTAPSLAISDYAEIQRLLGQASDPGEVFAIVSQDQEILLSDYKFLPLVKQSLGLDREDRELSCDNLSKRISFKLNDYRAHCSRLERAASVNMPASVSAIQISYHTVNTPWPFLKTSLVFAGLASLTLFAALFIFKLLVSRRLLGPMERLTKAVRHRSKYPLVAEPDVPIENAPKEVQTLSEAFSSLITSFRRQYEVSQEASKCAALYEQSRQIGHDIRSPLLALSELSESASDLPEDTRTMLRKAVGRIRDIGNKLLETKTQSEKRRQQLGGGSPTASQNEPCLVAGTISSIASEKRCQYQSRSEIKIVEKLDHEALGLFSTIPRDDLQRVISNLIDNACEAIKKDGLVEVALSQGDGSLRIEVKDNGRGISPNIMDRVFEAGFSAGKSSGSGLGLSYSKKIIEGNGGKIFLNSEYGYGTRVRIELPASETPEWYVGKLKIPARSQVVIADDDQSVHEVWKSKFRKCQKNRSLVHLIHLSKTDELKEFVIQNATNLRNIRFLIDQEFLNGNETGLEVISDLGIEKQSILVTSLAEEPDVLAACEEHHVKLLPKSLVRSVSLAIG